VRVYDEVQGSPFLRDGASGTAPALPGNSVAESFFSSLRRRCLGRPERPTPVKSLGQGSAVV
jgi:hypothetical protein